MIEFLSEGCHHLATNSDRDLHIGIEATLHHTDTATLSPAVFNIAVLDSIFTIKASLASLLNLKIV